MARCTGTSKTTSFWNITAWVVWTIALIVLVARPLLLSQRGTSFDTYSIAGSHWLHGENVYAQWMGFVYSPVVATFFAPFALLPTPLANIFLRLVNAAALLGGLAALLRSNVFAGIKPQRSGIVFLLMLPLALGNIDISQANPLVAGLIMLAIAAVYTKHWNWAAFCVAIATLFKIYPIAVALLICVIAPRRFTWRFFIALFLLSLLPFLFQNWSYVSQQYNAWIARGIANNRETGPSKNCRWIYGSSSIGSYICRYLKRLSR